MWEQWCRIYKKKSKKKEIVFQMRIDTTFTVQPLNIKRYIIKAIYFENREYLKIY